MIKEILLCALLALSSAKQIQPRDLADEALEQLRQLQTMVASRIEIAHEDIVDLGNDFRWYARDAYSEAAIDLQQEQETVSAQIATLEGLANSAGHDVTTCVSDRVDGLQNLVVSYNVEMSECIENLQREKDLILRDAKYYIDIIINKVHVIELQLTSCDGDILCIGPLVNQIELYKVELLREVLEEVLAMDEILATLKLSVPACTDSKVSEFVSDANFILQEVTTCINDIMG